MASLADGGSVDDGSDLLDVAGQETVEEVDVCVSQVSEVLVLVNGILLVLEELKASLFLCLEALDGRRGEAVCAEVLADLDGVCSVVVGASAKGVRRGPMAVTECRKVTHDCLEETAGGWLWVMFAAGAGATDAEEDMMDEMWMDARREEVEGRGRLSRVRSTRAEDRDIEQGIQAKAASGQQFIMSDETKRKGRHMSEEG